MTAKPDVTTPPPGTDQKLSPAARATLVVLACLALALGGAGAAYAGSPGNDGASDGAEDSAWVTVVEDDAPRSRGQACPEDASEDGL